MVSIPECVICNLFYSYSMSLEDLRIDPSPPRFIGVVVLIVWLCLMVSLFWLFQFRYTSNWVSFMGAEFQSVVMPTIGSQAMVVHFVDPDCPCTRFSELHIEQLEQQWQAVQFKTVTVGGVGEMNRRLEGYIPASPAVAMWDRDGVLQYFGPYTAGQICGEGEDLLSKALANPGEGQWLNQEAVGCFCPWPLGAEI